MSETAKKILHVIVKILRFAASQFQLLLEEKNEIGNKKNFD